MGLGIGIGIGIGIKYSTQGAGGAPLTAKTSGIIVRYNDQEDLATLMSEYGESITIALLNIGLASKSDEAKWKRISGYGQDVGVWNAVSTNAAFVVHDENTDYYQDQDDLEAAGDKGIMEFLDYGGYRYCLANVEYPSDPLILGDDVAQVDFSTISGGSNITIVNPFVSGSTAVYLDSTKSYASNFPATALDKWWILYNNGDGTSELRMNALIPLSDYISAQTGNGNYTGSDQLVCIKFNTYYPRLNFIKYTYQENKRNFATLGLPAPASMGEVEHGGYPTWDRLGNDWYDVMNNLGYKGATKDPLGRAYVNMKSEDLINKYRIPASSVTRISSLSTLQEIKEQIADNFAKKLFSFDRNHVLASPLDLTGWENLIQWCQINSIPILSYKDYSIKHFDREYSNDDIFPALDRDIAGRADGTPDGFDPLPVGITLETAGGSDKDNGYYLQFANASSAKASIDKLYGFDLGDNVLTVYAKNDGTAKDVIKITSYDPTSYITDFEERQLLIPVNSDTWVQHTVYFPAYSVGNAISIEIDTWASAGTVDISGVEIKKRELSVADGYEPESSALFTRMLAVSEEPDVARKTLIDNTIKALKNAEVTTGVNVNLWDRVLALHTHAAHGENAAKLNWKEDEYNMTVYNSPTYTVDRGWALNGTNQYIGSGFTPSSVNEWGLNDGTLMVYINVNNGLVNYAMDLGARPSTTNRTAIAVNYDANYTMQAINGSAQVNRFVNATPANRVGMYGVSRMNNLRLRTLYESDQILTQNNAGEVITPSELLYGRHSTTYQTNRYAFGLIAKGMDEYELKKFTSIIESEYLSKIGATV